MKNKKSERSMISNIFYFLKILFKISPLLVIGECLWGIMLKLPTRLVSVIGAKYVIDAVSQGKGSREIFTAVFVIALVLIISRTACWLFREFFWNIAKERANADLSRIFYEKAKSLDLECYDNPRFYNNFILTIESSSDNIQNVMGLVEHYIGELVSLITIASILLTIDPVCLVIILAVVAALMYQSIVWIEKKFVK